ncbi:MAG: OmpH family outer membrane protein [Bacteroidales bacterium]|nr:OmpH family outer membrane protein [Bacteroidales bacterium]
MKTRILLLIAFLGLSFALQAQKFAFVDTKYILDNIPEYQAAQTSLDEMSMEWQAELEIKFKEIDSLYKAFQSEAFLLPEDAKVKRQDEIIAKEKEAKSLQKKYFGTEGDLVKKRQELLKPIQDKVFNAVEQIAEDGAYAIIFDKSGSMSMIYTNPKFDKSDEVLESMGLSPGGVSNE